MDAETARDPAVGHGDFLRGGFVSSFSTFTRAADISLGTVPVSRRKRASDAYNFIVKSLSRLSSEKVEKYLFPGSESSALAPILTPSGTERQ